MNCTRLIPRLDIKGPNLVKGIHLEGLRVLGAPEAFAKFYFESGADELIFQDVVASLYQRNSLTEIIARTAKDVFIPLTVGGGIRSLEDINMALRAGADKVAINTAAIANPDLINKASKVFGSSTIVIAIEVAKNHRGEYEAYTDNGRETTNRDAVVWADEVASRGAGEILLTSIDREGTGLGLDLELIEQVTKAVDIPVVAHGGVGTRSHIEDAVTRAGADAVAIASLLHYTAVKSPTFEGFEAQLEGNTEFLMKNRNSSKFKSMTIDRLKFDLKKSGLTIR